MLGSRYVSVKRTFSSSEARGSSEVILPLVERRLIIAALESKSAN
jgi:hypothetical protein